MARGLGFGDEDLDRGLATFSGGELTRASLARALATGADLLLLDEPTNHLDIESLEWLEQTLVGLDAAVVLVAHDRWFLETVGTAVLELEGRAPARASSPGPGTLAARAGGARARARPRDRAPAGRGRAARALRRALALPARKARQAQSRAKALAKIERIERAPRDGAALSFAFRPPERTGRVIFELEDGARSRSARPAGVVLLEHAELWLERGEHVALVGPNGSGKTTLIETLAGPAPARRGQAAHGPQRQRRLPLPAHRRARRGGPPGQRRSRRRSARPGLTPNKARALLGRFLFGGELAEKPLDGLSGGERRRLSLAILVAGANRRTC